MKAYVFPGQGSQFSGMGKDLYDNHLVARTMFDNANEILGFSISEIMFNGTPENLKQTNVTQPAVFLHSVILTRCLTDFNPDMVAGHSLGEFSALVACGALDFESALKLVAVRARAMQKACELNPGTMAAVITLPEEKITEICDSCEGIVVPANYNSKRQVVISGEITSVEQACLKMKEAGARRALVLPVGGAFHSPLMEPARQELAECIESTHFNIPICPIYQNVTAYPTTNPTEIKSNLLKQLTSPVRWTHTIETMLADGATEFIEVGPGNVLQGLISQISSDAIVSTGGHSDLRNMIE